MNWREDRTLIVLCSGLFFYTIIVLAVVYTKDDVQLYSLFSGVFGQFSGALFMHMRGDKVPPAGSTTETQVTQVSSVPPEVKP